ICEEQWIDLLDRIARRALPRGETLHVDDTEKRFRYPENFHQTFATQRWFQVPSVPTSLGCPYDCNFCSAYMQGRYLLRSIDTIYKELGLAPGRMVFLCDATFGLNKRFTLELMEAIAPLRKDILIETTLTRLADHQVLDALGRGGIKWISVGVESLA